MDLQQVCGKVRPRGRAASAAGSLQAAPEQGEEWRWEDRVGAPQMLNSGARHVFRLPGPPSSGNSGLSALFVLPGVF